VGPKTHNPKTHFALGTTGAPLAPFNKLGTQKVNQRRIMLSGLISSCVMNQMRKLKQLHKHFPKLALAPDG